MNCKQIREEIDAAARSNLRSDLGSHLKDCPDCRRYSDETASLLGLLKAQPRVEAPTDFEFRLRARIARAQAVAESGRQGFLWKILPETFSWGQMAAATAALALVVTVSTFHARRADRAANPISSGDAAVAEAVDSASISADKESEERKSPEIEAFASESAVAPLVKFTSRSARAVYASYPSDIPADTAEPNDITDTDGSTRLYNPKTKRLLNDRSRFYGAETVSISMSRPQGAVLTF